MFYQVKCKHASILCVGILLVHFILVALTSQLDTGQVLLSRDTRDTEDFQDPSEIFDRCTAGHLDGLPAICDSQGCLRVLERPVDIVPSEGVVNISTRGLPLSSVAVGGRVAPIHLDLLGLITYIQRQHDIYGTVAGIGAGEPLLTVVLASQLDLKAGEHLILSDPSTTSTTRSSAQLDSLLNPLEQDFTANFHVHTGSPAELTKGLLRGMSLPQCRIVVVEGSHDSATIFLRLEKALCLLREGGIVILDGMDRNQEHTYRALRQFFTTFGSEILTPLLSTQDKLYLCTARLRRKYVEHIARPDFLVSFHGREVRTSLYGPTYSYYTLLR